MIFSISADATFRQEGHAMDIIRNRKSPFLTAVKVKSLIVKVSAVLIWIFVWEIVSRVVNLELLVPSVGVVFMRLVAMVQTTNFWGIALNSVFRILTGFAAGTALGVILAILTTSSYLVKELFKPVMSIIRATPIVSFIILALVWIQGGNIPAFISFLMVFPIIWGNVSKGITQADPLLLEMTRIYEIPFLLRIRKIYFHSVLPYLGAAATTSMGLAWKAGIAAEVIATPQRAVGTEIYNSRLGLETADLFAWSIIVILMSVLLERLMEKALYRVSPLESERRIIPSNERSDGYTDENLPEIDRRANRWEIKINSLDVNYGSERVISNLSAVLPKNGCIRLSGASGVGKTTLLKTVAGLITPSSGTLSFDPSQGKPVISYVFQEDRLIPWISVLDNVTLALHGRSRKMNASVLAVRILGFMGLKDALHKYPRELSGGMRQRVNLARAFVVDADILLLDEPLKGLDAALRARMIRLISELKQSKLILLVTHANEEADLLADLTIRIDSLSEQAE
jgi:NitT/TauT family transport system permease protein